MIIVECILVISSVIFYLWFGCFVGREFGSYEKLVLKILDKILDNLKNKHIAQQKLPGSDETK